MTLALILNVIFILVVVGGLVALLSWAINSERKQRQAHPGVERRGIRAAYAKSRAYRATRRPPSR